MLSNVYFQKSKVKIYGLIILLVALAGSDLFAQKNATARNRPVPDQFPVSRMWDDAVVAARKSGKPALVFDVDYVDSNSILFRDRILRDLEVQSYLNATFELGVNDYSVDPPPTVGLDSLRNLGLRLDALEKGFNINQRPTVILLRGDTTEIDRIVHPERMTPKEFMATLADYLKGRNVLSDYRDRFWKDSTNETARLAYLNKLADHAEYDSVLLHLSVLARSAHDKNLVRAAAKEYALMKFQLTGSPRHIEQWIATLDRRNDSLEIYDALTTLLEFHQRSKRIDSIAHAYEKIFAFTGDRDPDLLNNFAWDLANFSTRFDSAMTTVNEAIAKNAGNANYYDTRALIHFLHEDFEAAAADSKKALSLAVTDEDKKYYRERIEFYEHEAKDKREYLSQPENKK